MRIRRRNREGFTLIEIMFVILILGLLATLVLPRLRGAADKAKRVKAEADIASLKTALDRYYLDNGSYPTTDQGLQALASRPNSGRAPQDYPDGGYVERVPLDPWGSQYFYQSDGSTYVLKSYGPNGSDGGQGGGGGIDGSQS